MWPSLVAKKLLRKSNLQGNNNFVTNIIGNSTETTLLEVPSSNKAPPSPNSYSINHPNTYKLVVSSWNVGGITPPKQLQIDDWLDTQNHLADIYVLGFQEIVPLNPGNILGSESSRNISLQWNSLIRSSLNKSTKPTQDESSLEESSGAVDEFRNVDSSINYGSSSGWDFQCIASKQMVGIFLTVWARSDLRQYIHHTSVTCVGCGIMGCLGNKGAVSVRFCFHETSFCFVCSHLASGGKEGDEKHRNADAADILSRTSFPRGPLHNLPGKILHHDRVIWLGDLNYRIYLPESTTRSLVERRQWSILLQNDQLRAEFTEGRVFEGWQEEAIKFAPTYKYHANSDEYYDGHQRRKGKKMRTPAWCDRIIWFGKGLKQNQYSRGECRLSDHRPVRAIFTAEVNVLRPSDRSETFLSSSF